MQRDKPIFILASGQRCGSTLLQRLLNSHKDVMIWGEQRGFLNGLSREYRALLAWEDQYRSQRQSFLHEGYDGFLPNLLPAASEIESSLRGFVASLFGGPAQAMGRSRWGFKEVRYDAELAGLLQDLFPEARIIHLTRNVVDCFISLKHWENAPGGWCREWTELFLADWCRINASFLTNAGSWPRVLSLQYEEFLGKRDFSVERICHYIDISPADLDLGVFNRRLHTDGPNGDRPRPPISRQSLTGEERALLLKPPIPEIARALGYEIEFG